MDILGVSFDNYHTWRDWGLYQMGPASLSLPVVQSNYISVPGRDGYLDMSTALTGEVTYKTREFSCPFMSLASSEDWPALYSRILNAIHGQKMKIVLDEDPDYYYEGRVAVETPDYDGSWQFSITGVVSPWKYKIKPTEISRKDLTTDYKPLTLPNERRPVVPTITVTEETRLLWKDTAYVISPGTHRLLNIRLAAGDNVLKAQLVLASRGTITVAYQEASL